MSRRRYTWRDAINDEMRGLPRKRGRQPLHPFARVKEKSLVDRAAAIKAANPSLNNRRIAAMLNVDVDTGARLLRRAKKITRNALIEVLRNPVEPMPDDRRRDDVVEYIDLPEDVYAAIEARLQRLRGRK